MGRRRKKEPPASTAWASYTPRESKYWFFGRPWVPPEEIPPAVGYVPKPEDVDSYSKPEARFRHAIAKLDEYTDKLPGAIAGYVDLHERGIDALEYDWMKEKLRAGDYDRGEPNHLHYSLCNAYGEIARLKAYIPVYQAVVDQTAPAVMPLFARPKKP